MHRRLPDPNSFPDNFCLCECHNLGDENKISIENDLEKTTAAFSEGTGWNILTGEKVGGAERIDGGRQLWWMFVVSIGMGLCCI